MSNETRSGCGFLAGCLFACVLAAAGAGAFLFLRVRPRPPVAPGGPTASASAGASQETFDATPETPPAGATALALVLDTSGSMSEPVGADGTKLDVAKRVLTGDFLPLLSDDVFVALYRFEGRAGVELAPLRRNASRDAPHWLHREAVMELVDRTVASGGTPIAASLRRTRASLERVSGRRIVVLVTDGEESFEGKPGVLAEVAANRAAKVETYAVGFNLGSQGTYLEQELGLGKGYFQANGGREALLAAMTSVLSAIEK